MSIKEAYNFETLQTNRHMLGLSVFLQAAEMIFGILHDPTHLSKLSVSIHSHTVRSHVQNWSRFTILSYFVVYKINSASPSQRMGRWVNNLQL